MKFDVIIGNPPYQGESNGEGRNFAPPVYHDFLEAAYGLADRVCMVHPARFLFNAGSTPRVWNKKMLEDKHLKVVLFAANSAALFPGTDIKGGVAVTYRDAIREGVSIGVFTPSPVINNIKEKVWRLSKENFSSIVGTAFAYHFTEILYEEHPELLGRLSKGHDYDLKSNLFEKMPEIFTEEKPRDKEDYIQIYGRLGMSRAIRWVRKKYVNEPSTLNYWTIFMPAASGSGTLGEALPPVFIGSPGVGATESFLNIGRFETRKEAESCLKYIKTKFSRLLHNILKITQNGAPETWRLVPLQDFTAGSDIDWGVSVAEVDAQLYRKYGLSAEEVAFIESKVKEMA